jgi:DNA-binding GntR family transcriptional regulator
MTALSQARQRPPEPTEAGRRQALRTLPEQIADDIGGDIVRGTTPPGSRLRETEIAARYNVSRAPVREAIRLLARRGLVDFYPRRGAFVVEMTIDKFIDIFNVMVMLLGMAARKFADSDNPGSLELLRERTEALAVLAADPATPTTEFAFAAWKMSDVMSRNCGSKTIGELLSHQLRDTAWSTTWRHLSLDYTTPERRTQIAQAYARRLTAIANRDADLAERLTRETSLMVRDHSVQVLVEVRGETFDTRRLLVR